MTNISSVQNVTFKSNGNKVKNKQNPQINNDYKPSKENEKKIGLALLGLAAIGGAGVILAKAINGRNVDSSDLKQVQNATDEVKDVILKKLSLNEFIENGGIGQKGVFKSADGELFSGILTTSHKNGGEVQMTFVDGVLSESLHEYKRPDGIVQTISKKYEKLEDGTKKVTINASNLASSNTIKTSPIAQGHKGKLVNGTFQDYNATITTKNGQTTKEIILKDGTKEIETFKKAQNYHSIETIEPQGAPIITKLESYIDENGNQKICQTKNGPYWEEKMNFTDKELIQKSHGELTGLLNDSYDYLVSYDGKGITFQTRTNDLGYDINGNCRKIYSSQNPKGVVSFVLNDNENSVRYPQNMDLEEAIEELQKVVTLKDPKYFPEGLGDISAQEVETMLKNATRI